MPLSRRAMAARPAPYLDDLNPAQRAAVEALDGPVLMLAGAGTGKTKALTARIVHLLTTGRARPNEILAVTFTNKAAREMKDRVGRMLGEAVEGMPWMGTFHSISRQDPAPPCRTGRAEVELHHSGHRRPAAPAEAADRRRQYRRKALARADAGRADRRLEEPRADARRRCRRPKPGPTTTAGPSFTRPYQDRLKTLNAIDFGDLLLHVRDDLPGASGRAGAVPALVPLHPGGRVSGHQRRPVPVAAAAGAGASQHLLRGRRRPVDLWLARGRGGQHPAVRKGFSRRQGDPAGAELPLHPAYPCRRLRRDRRQRGAAGQDAVDRGATRARRCA